MIKLAIRNVGKDFGGTPAVRDFSLDIATGAFVSLLGPSGCGKTTMLRMIAGFIAPSRGTIELNGQVLSSPSASLPPEKRGMSMIFQSYALWPHMTVAENVAFGLQLRHLPAKEIRQRVDEVLGVVRLINLSGRYPAELSGGQQQRVALARALVKRPQLLLLDEPLSALDANLRRQMQLELKSLQREVGIAFVFVTHDQEEAMIMSDRIALLRTGELEQVASPREIYARPATAYTAQFIGRTNLLRGEAHDGVMRCHSLCWPTNLPNSSVLLSLRPENIRMAASSGAPGAVRFRGKMRHRAFQGATELLQIESTDGLAFTVRAPARSDWEGVLAFEFDPADAAPVRESAEKV